MAKNQPLRKRHWLAARGMRPCLYPIPNIPSR
jgi:hypothetical protein